MMICDICASDLVNHGSYSILTSREINNPLARVTHSSTGNDRDVWVLHVCNKCNEKFVKRIGDILKSLRHNREASFGASETPELYWANIGTAPRSS